MLKNTFDWLKVAALRPDDSMVKARSDAASDLVTSLREADDVGLVIECAAGTVGGFDLLGDHSQAVYTVLECVRKYQPAFPGALTENALQLRVCSAIALGELLSAPASKAENVETLAACLISAGLGVRQTGKGKHLEAIMEQLAALARANLQQRAVAQRTHMELSFDDLDALMSLADTPAAPLKKFILVIKDLFSQAQKRYDCDHEELEVLWWLYNSYSDRLNKPLQQVNAMQAAAAIGREIADKVVPLAPAGIRELLARAASKGRAAKELKAKPLAKLVSDLAVEGRKLLLPPSVRASRVVKDASPSLPLSWLALRLEESGGADGWETEFRSKTGLAPDRELTPPELAAQIFEEQQAQRFYEMTFEEHQ